LYGEVYGFPFLLGGLNMADARLNMTHKPFEIEVNGKGETITVDVMSLDFPLRFQKAYESILKIENKAKAEELIISKKRLVSENNKLSG